MTKREMTRKANEVRKRTTALLLIDTRPHPPPLRSGVINVRNIARGRHHAAKRTHVWNTSSRIKNVMNERGMNGRERIKYGTSVLNALIK